MWLQLPSNRLYQYLIWSLTGYLDCFFTNYLKIIFVINFYGESIFHLSQKVSVCHFYRAHYTYFTFKLGPEVRLKISKLENEPDCYNIAS